MGNMVGSLDGRATVGSRSGPLGSPADKAVFHFLRTLADVVLVGARTVRMEGYGPARGPDPSPLAVVSRSLELDWESRFFTEAAVRPFVITCESADAGRRRQASAVADVVVAGDDAVEIGQALEELRQRGHRVLLCEGGPTLLGEIVQRGLLDELCLTLSPVLVGGVGPSILNAPNLSPPLGLTLATLLEEEGFLFLRYRR